MSTRLWVQDSYRDNQVNPDTPTFSARSIERIRRQEKKKRMMKRGEKRIEELPGLLEGEADQRIEMEQLVRCLRTRDV